MSQAQTDSTLYEVDFLKWADQQAKAVATGRRDRIDVPNLVEEIESMGRAQRNALRGHLRVLAVHLLKLQFQPEPESRSWRSTIIEQADSVNDLPAAWPHPSRVQSIHDQTGLMACRGAASISSEKTD